MNLLSFVIWFVVGVYYVLLYLVITVFLIANVFLYLFLRAVVEPAVDSLDDLGRELVESWYLLDKDRNVVVESKTAKVGRENVEMHYLRCYRRNPDRPRSGRSLVFIHGINASSATVVSGLYGRLLDAAKVDEVYAFDMLGFGRSQTPESFLDQSNEEIVHKIIDSFHDMIVHLRISEPYVVAHSLGGFFASRYASKYPHEIKKLILVSPAGMFPTLGDVGMYFALVFTLELPMGPLAELDRTGPLLRAVYRYRVTQSRKRLQAGMDQNAPDLEERVIQYRNDLKQLYDLQLASTRSCIGRSICRRFISLSMDDGYWNCPAFSHLLSLPPGKVGFIYGSEDTLLPSHQGAFLSLLRGAESSTPVCIIQGAGHSPFITNGGDAFVGAVTRICTAARPTSVGVLKNSQSKSFNCCPYASRFYIPDTNKIIRDLYIKLYNYYVRRHNNDDDEQGMLREALSHRVTIIYDDRRVESVRLTKILTRVLCLRS